MNTATALSSRAARANHAARTAPHPTLQRLEAGEAMSLPAERGATLSVTEGQLWLTVAGDPDDHLLGPGSRHELSPTHLTVVECVGGPSATWQLLRSR